MVLKGFQGLGTPKAQVTPGASGALGDTGTVGTILGLRFSL